MLSSRRGNTECSSCDKQKAEVQQTSAADEPTLCLYQHKLFDSLTVRTWIPSSPLNSYLEACLVNDCLDFNASLIQRLGQRRVQTFLKKSNKKFHKPDGRSLGAGLNYIRAVRCRMLGFKRGTVAHVKCTILNLWPAVTNENKRNYRLSTHLDLALNFMCNSNLKL